ncbi:MULTISPECIES: phage tail tube protein [Streptomyces]
MPDEVKRTDNALAANKGYVFIGKPEKADGTGATALPKDITENVVKSVTGQSLDEDGQLVGVATGWLDIGNTSLENGIELANDGDDPEVLGSWQNPAIKTTTPAKVFSLTIALNDFTAETYRLYYGAGETAFDKATGQFTIPTTPTSQKHSLLIVARDGNDYVTFYYPKAEIIGADSITLDPSALSEIPVKATILGSKNEADGMGKISEKKTLAPDAPKFL